MPYVKPEDRDTSWYLFNERFMCRIKYIDTLSKDYIKIFGMPTIFDKTEDMATANEWTTFYKTIDQMAELYRNRATIKVVHTKDTKRIYEIISNHLEAWKTELTRTLNVKGAPIEDLLLLDELANAVYPHAKHHFTHQYVQSNLLQAMLGAAPAIQNTLNAPNSEEKKAIVDSGHKSMADVFNSYRSEGGYSEGLGAETYNQNSRPFSWRE